MNKNRWIVVLSALVVLNIGWIVVDHFRESPLYTYGLLRLAIHNRNWNLFAKNVNFDSLKSNWQEDALRCRRWKMLNESFITNGDPELEPPPAVYKLFDYGNVAMRRKYSHFLEHTFSDAFYFLEHLPDSATHHDDDDELPILKNDDDEFSVLQRMKQLVDSGLTDVRVFPELFSLKSEKVLKVDTEGVVLAQYGTLGVPARVRLKMYFQNGRGYILQGVDRSELVYRNGIMAVALRRWATRPTEEKILKSISVSVLDFVNDYRSNFWWGGEARPPNRYISKVSIYRKVTNHSSNDVSAFVYDVCPDWWLVSELCVRFVDRDIGSQKSFSSWTSVRYVPTIMIPELGTPDTISNLPVRRRRIIPIKVIFANGDSIAVDQYAYLKRKQPSWQELVAFMKHDSLQYADSIEMWYKGLR